jgi:peptide/nickel transport system permease protein
VSLIFFILSRLIPGDRVETVLDYRGLSLAASDNEYYHKEYQKLEKQLGLNLPSFYFQIYPSFSTNNGFSFQNTRINNWCRKMKRKKYADTEIKEVGYELDLIYKEVDVLPDSIGHNYVSSFFSEEDFTTWNLIIIDWKKQDLPKELYASIDKLQTTLSKLEYSRIGFYYPILKWNGIENQYHNWISSVFKSKLGVSIIDGRDVTEKIWAALRWTLLLVLISLIISLAISVFLSAWLLIQKREWLVSFFETILNGMYAMPIFWLATLLIVFFTTREYGAWTDWFAGPLPVVNESSDSFWDHFLSRLSYLILPILCLVIKEIPVFTRIIFVGMEEQMKKPYAQAMRAKGLPPNKVVFNHLLPNALFPVITLVSNYLPGALAGSLIIEVIFNIPGMGRLLFNSLFSGEYEICFGILLLVTVFTVVIFSFADLLYKWVSPQLKQQ